MASMDHGVARREPYPLLSFAVADRCLVESKIGPVAIQLTAMVRVAYVHSGLAGLFDHGDESRIDSAMPDPYSRRFVSHDGQKVRWMKKRDSHNGLEVLLHEVGILIMASTAGRRSLGEQHDHAGYQSKTTAVDFLGTAGEGTPVQPAGSRAHSRGGGRTLRCKFAITRVHSSVRCQTRNAVKVRRTVVLYPSEPQRLSSGPLDFQA